MINSYNEHKRFLIMNIVNHLGAISRTELASLTGYQPSNIGSLTKQLIEENVLIETGSYSSGHGRKRILLELNKQHLCAISISFSSTKITFIVAQFDGTVLSTTYVDFSQDLSEQQISTSIKEHIHSLLDTYQERDVIGIGICTPSNDPGSSPIAIVHSNYQRLGDWIRKVLLPDLSESFPIPINLFHDVTLAILVEQSFGSAKGIDDFICVELSNGLGCSICCNGKAVSGSTGIAGELGHTIIDINAQNQKPCYCGKFGCVESVASFPELRKAICNALKSNVLCKLGPVYEANSKITLDDIREAMEAGDHICRHYVKQAAIYLGAAISNAVVLLNPRLIVLYGHMLNLGDYFLDNLKTAILENVTNETEFEIVVNPRLEELLPLGVISEVFSSYLKKEDFNWVYQLPTLTDETQNIQEKEE